jgi:hypothetical protein
MATNFVSLLTTAVFAPASPAVAQPAMAAAVPAPATTYAGVTAAVSPDSQSKPQKRKMTKADKRE